ncbi:hypothetical protein ACIPWF_10615 [Paenarthrobacter sp. NPDC089989]|uniref:hypothetical protein n=1 Tax=unclassified Paenarthrobacter TaxID=2634190 RepID=UPI0037F2E744
MSEVKPLLGVILCDLDSYPVDYVECLTPDAPGISDNPVGFFENPASWQGLPVAYAVARGARVEPLVNGEPEAVEAFWAASEKLAHCPLVITDCGFFFYARKDMRQTANVITSGLDLLPIASVLTSKDIGVLTVSESLATKLLGDHVLSSRIVIAGMEGEPGWATMLTNDHALGNGWDQPLLKEGVASVVRREFGPGGRFENIGVLVLECTLLPEFRREIRKYTSVPILDVASFALNALGAGFDAGADAADGPAADGNSAAGAHAASVQ